MPGFQGQNLLSAHSGSKHQSDAESHAVLRQLFHEDDLTGKTIIPFATSGGSGMGETNEHLASSCKGAKLIEGKVFNHSTSHKELVAWVDGLRI